MKQLFGRIKVKADSMSLKTTNYVLKLKGKAEHNKIYKNLTDTSTYKRTMLLSVFYVFLLYFPFTFLTLVFDQVVFFQLDYLYQFATIIFDFRNRVFDLNFSTWDWKNTIGYDYFANFYYVQVDFSLLPYFLFPFISFSKQMWLSFLLKVVVGTGLFSYLLKLYKLNHKTILFASILYGTADLFLALNVFPTFTNLVYNIPLILIAIELIFQKKNYWIFSLVIFHILMSNFYWGWLLTLFMALALFFRTIYAFVNKENYYNPLTYLKILLFWLKCLLFYLIGFGLAAFFVLPIANVMMNEPRMGELQGESALTIDRLIKTLIPNWDKGLIFEKVVYLKTILKTLIPNLYNYSGYFYDNHDPYWVPTNHIIIYSSILASFTLFQFLLYPTILVKKKLNPKQLKIYLVLKSATIFTVILMVLPFVAHIFSLTPTPYLRWYVFFGVLLIINLAFLIEFKIFNMKLFYVYLILSIFYLMFSIKYNNYPDVPKEGFFGVDEGIVYTFITVYSVILVFMTIFDKYKGLGIFLFIERLAFIGSIYVICVSVGFSNGTKHADVYGVEVNNLMKNIQLKNEYNFAIDFLAYNDYEDIEGMQNMSYLFDFEVNNNLNIFHSLINPYYTFYRTNEGHERYYKELDLPFLYYYYMDPTLFIFSESTNTTVDIGIFDPTSTKVAEKEIKEFQSVIKIYEKDPNFSIGTGFHHYYNKRNLTNYEYQFLNAVYLHDKDMIEKIKNAGFTEEVITKNRIFESKTYSYSSIEDYEFDNFPERLSFKKLDVSVDRAESEFLIINYYWNGYIRAIFTIDNNDQIARCYNRFCHVPESGIKGIIMGYNTADAGRVDGKLELYTLDKELFNAQVEELKNNSTYDVKINGNTVEAKINNEEQLLMTFKIGYAKGWSVYVNNQKMETFPSYNGQLTFMLTTTGKQDIRLVYETPWLKEGIKITLGAIVVFTGYISCEILVRMIKRRRQHAKVS